MLQHKELFDLDHLSSPQSFSLGKGLIQGQTTPDRIDT